MANNDKVVAAKKAAQAQVKAQERKALVMWIVVGVVLVGAFAALVAYIVRANDVAPLEGEDNGGLGVGASGVVGQDLDPSHVRLDIYFDFMCPYCNLFEQTQGDTVDELRSAGTVDVYYHPLNFLDRLSQGSEYSTRSASAAALIANEEPDKFLDFVKIMFENQPAENSSGLSDDQIVDLAKQAGVSDEVANKIPDHEYASWVRSATETASQDGVAFTPQLALNGKLQDPQSDSSAVNWGEDGALKKAIEDLAGK